MPPKPIYSKKIANKAYIFFVSTIAMPHISFSVTKQTNLGIYFRLICNLYAEIKNEKNQKHRKSRFVKSLCQQESSIQSSVRRAAQNPIQAPAPHNAHSRPGSHSPQRASHIQAPALPHRGSAAPRTPTQLHSYTIPSPSKAGMKLSSSTPSP